VVNLLKFLQIQLVHRQTYGTDLHKYKCMRSIQGTHLSNAVKPVLNGTWPQRKPLFIGKHSQSRGSAVPRIYIAGTYMKRNLPAAKNFGPLLFRYKQVSLYKYQYGSMFRWLHFQLSGLKQKINIKVKILNTCLRIF
jgi:hypothetical protein